MNIDVDVCSQGLTVSVAVADICNEDEQLRILDSVLMQKQHSFYKCLESLK